MDTAQAVLAPDGGTINEYAAGGSSDEHQSVFPPGSLGANKDYLFFLSTGTKLNVDIGMTVLSGGAGPGKNGQWTFDFPKSDGYGSYSNGYGVIFVAPTTQGRCPTVADGNPAHQDATFDLGYASPGSVVNDPTGPAGSLLMIYEGVNTCAGTIGGTKSSAYTSTGVATSLDYGKTWPTYRGTSTFNFVNLPDANKTQGPNAPSGAVGKGVCTGIDCSTPPPAAYGRYPVLSTPTSLTSLIAGGKAPVNLSADGEPSAFLDDGDNYVYLVHGYNPGAGDPPLADGRNSDLMLARAQLNGGTAKLNFLKWNGTGYTSAGVGGLESPILADGSFESCSDTKQSRSQGSIGYVESTQQYLLLFVCNSPGAPSNGKGGGRFGASWFYATTYDLSSPNQWSVPQEIEGTWNEWDSTGGCPSYPGWYPTAMSLGAKPGHLALTGYMFYMFGCLGGSSTGMAPKRQYSSRMFTIAFAAQPPLAISTSQLPAGTVGVAYSQALAATGGSGTFDWTVSAGALPDGLALSPAGLISGTPATAGSATFTVKATDSKSATATQDFTLTIAPAASPSGPLVLSADGATVYDSANQINWLADANLAASNRFGLPVCKGTAADPKTCINPSGSMSYQAAAAWVAAMNAANYLGHNAWQLPTSPATESGCGFNGPAGITFGWNCSASALGSLYYNALGLNAPNTAVPIPANTTGPFSNFQPYLYWSQSTHASGTGYGTFSFASGFQGSNTEPNFIYLLPMIPGKIAGTPAAPGKGLQVNPGGQTVYDPVTNVTWLANANLAATDTLGLPACKGPGNPKLCANNDGAMNWNSASQFIVNMNAGKGYLGQTKWQMPAVDQTCDVTYRCSELGAANPFGELYYNQLNLSPGTPVVATPNTATGPFKNLQPYLYWSCEGATIQGPCQPSGPAAGFQWSFSFGNGFEGTDVFPNDLYVTAYFVGPPASIAGPVISTSSQLPAGVVGAAYSLSLAATGGTPPYVWSLSASTLPDGLALTPDGLISGTPTIAGSATFTVQVTDSNSASALMVVTLVIQPPSAVIVSFFVSTAGNDSWSGTLSAPNAAGTDGPFATFDAARAAVQAVNQLNVAQIVVQFRGGTYYLPSTVQFTAADSGSASTPIIYQNYPGETPVLSGGMPLGNWTNAGGNKWQATLPPSTQYFENLFYNGVRRLRPRLGGSLGTFYRIAKTVYLSGAAPLAAAPNANCAVYVAGSGWECFDRFQYDPKDPIANTWKNLAPPQRNPCGQPAGNPSLAGDIELLVFEQFTTSKLRVSCIDTANHIVYLTGPTGFSQNNSTADGFIAGNRYLVENVQDQLTQPGQWFLNRSTTPWTLTYLASPGDNPNNDSVIAPQLPQLLIASNLQYVTFQGLTFEHDNYTLPPAGHSSRELEPEISAAVSIQNSQYITFDSGIVSQISGVGLEIISCLNASSPAWCASRSTTATTAHNVIQNSAIYDIGALAIRIGGPFANLNNDSNVPQSIVVQNNVVEGYGRTIPASFGIGQGVGHDNLYTHNDVYDGYHCAISISELSGDTAKPNGIGTANNTISFNHVYNLMQGIMNDGGSIRIGSGNSVFTAAGNKILNNKIHDVSDASALDSNGYGGNGIYLDNQTGLVDVENNLVYRVSGNAVYTPQGPAAPKEPNTIRNNILAFARLSIVADEFPYSSGAPSSAKLAYVITNNIFYFDRSSASTPKFYPQGGCAYSAGFGYTQYQQWNSNLYWRTDGGFSNDAKAFFVQPSAGTGPDAPCTGDAAKYTFYGFGDWQQKVGEDVQSVIKNPGFANPAYPADDYSLPKGSPGAGFVVFDPSQAGRSNPVIKPPAVAATFATKPFDPAKDY